MGKCCTSPHNAALNETKPDKWVVFKTTKTTKHQFKSIQVVFDLQEQGFSHQQHLGKQHSAHQLRSRLGIVFIVFLVVGIVL